jgi:hypothetical protein
MIFATLVEYRSAIITRIIKIVLFNPLAIVNQSNNCSDPAVTEMP